MNIKKVLTLGIATTSAILVVLWLSGVFRDETSAAVRDVNAPFGRFASSVRNVFSGVANSIGDAATIRAENMQLHAENERLRAQTLLLDAANRENAELRKALALQEKNHSLISAEIVSRGEASGWWNVVRIDKGRDDGVELNGAVISIDGLVGRVVEVTSETAEVLLLTDANSKVSCYIEGTDPGARGVLTGMGVQKSEGMLDLMHVVEPMSLSYIEKELEIPEGARILTSGIGGLYPSGLPVGEVVSYSSDVSRLYRRALVAPYVDFASLKRVFVMPATAGARAFSVREGIGR